MNEDAICVWGIRPSASSLEDCTCSKSEPHDFKGCTHFSEMQVHLSPLQSLIVIFRLAFVRYSVCVRAHSLYHAALTLVPEASPVLSLTQHTHWDSRHLVTIQQINKDTSIMLEATCMGMCVCVCLCVFGLKTWTVMWSRWRRGQKAPVPLTFLLVPLAPCCAFRLWPRTLVYWASSVYKLSLSSSWIINNLSICLYTPTPPHPPITCSAALFNNKIQFILEHCICLASCLSLMWTHKTAWAAYAGCLMCGK